MSFNTKTRVVIKKNANIIWYTIMEDFVHINDDKALSAILERHQAKFLSSLSIIEMADGCYFGSSNPLDAFY